MGRREGGGGGVRGGAGAAEAGALEATESEFKQLVASGEAFVAMFHAPWCVCVCVCVCV